MAERTTTNEPRIDAPFSSGQQDDAAMEQIRLALAGLRFGTVSIIVQDGIVIQIERTERRRLRKSERA